MIRRTFNYKEIIRRDPCVWCGKRIKITIDHIHPKSKGGPNHWINYAPTCESCNRKKSSQSLLGFMMGGMKPGQDILLGGSSETLNEQIETLLVSKTQCEGFAQKYPLHAAMGFGPRIMYYES